MVVSSSSTCVLFFFNAPATPEIYTLSLHDALPISRPFSLSMATSNSCLRRTTSLQNSRSEEHTSELQSRLHLVCRLLLEKKKARVVDVGLDEDPHVDPLPEREVDGRRDVGLRGQPT